MAVAKSLAVATFLVEASVQAQQVASSGSYTFDKKTGANLLVNARIACANINSEYTKDFNLCVDDILSTGDVSLANLWPLVIDIDNPTIMTTPKEQSLLLLRQARIACAAVPHRQSKVVAATKAWHPEIMTTDFENCVEEIVHNGGNQDNKAALWMDVNDDDDDKTQQHRQANLRGNSTN